MKFVVYIIYSKVPDQYYTGHTADITDRLLRHQNFGSTSTKRANDFKLVYREVFEY